MTYGDDQSRLGLSFTGNQGWQPPATDRKPSNHCQQKDEKKRYQGQVILVQSADIRFATKFIRQRPVPAINKTRAILVIVSQAGGFLIEQA